MGERGGVAPTSKNFRSLSKSVVNWFASNARDLPWRRTRDPYAIWISEVMLQQTQVKTVIPYWERWMAWFPNLQILAEVPEEKLLKAWEGLGYYSRARNLQRAAKIICSSHDGRFPTRYDQILELPGIGRYTAGAICSIVYAQPTAILDGNVARVLARIFTVGGSVQSGATQKRLWSLSTSMVQTGVDCSALNQGLMELGATICLPRAPLCSRCPLRRRCHAWRQGLVEKFPERPERVTMRERRFLALIINRGALVLVRKRPATVVNGGLWEFPNVEMAAKEDVAATANSFGCALESLTTIRHTITRNRITLHAFGGLANGNAGSLARKLGSEWHAVAELQGLPFSSAHARLRLFVQGAHGIPNKGGVA